MNTCRRANSSTASNTQFTNRSCGKRQANCKSASGCYAYLNPSRLTRRLMMTTSESEVHEAVVTREELIELLNEDLAREYQAIISYVIYSQVLKGAQFMKIAAE